MFYFITYLEEQSHSTVTVNEIIKDEHPVAYITRMHDEFPKAHQVLLFFAEVPQEIGQHYFEEFQ